MRFVLSVALVGLVVCVGCRPGPTPDTVIAAIKELGGVVKIDENGTVVGVGFYDGGTVTDKDLVFLKGLEKLEEMVLNHTRVTDAGLVHLKGLSHLKRLNLGFADISDAGLVHLKELPRLLFLFLPGTRITDAGLAHLKELPKLERLWLSGTKVTDAGVNQLQQALPKYRLRTAANFHGPPDGD